MDHHCMATRVLTSEPPVTSNGLEYLIAEVGSKDVVDAEPLSNRA